MIKKKNEKTIANIFKINFKQTMLVNMGIAGLFLVLGILVYFNPSIAIKTVGILIGVYFMLFGLFLIYEYLLRNIISIFRFKVYFGIISFLLGIFIIVNPIGTINILTIALGIYLIVLSIMKMMNALKFKSIGFDGWLLMFVISILLLIAGIFVIINPMVSMDIVKVVGIFMILSSILDICNLFMLYGKAKEIEKNLLK